ncbi:MAG: GtrA family protein [Caryophanon sp.]|nr:GtrA family protein [Caryophanon sp.]
MKKIDKTFIKFLIVGIINTVVGTGIMFGLYNIAGFSYWSASFWNYFLASILSYFLNKYFTFQQTDKSWKYVVKFALNIVVCYVIAYALAKPLVLFVLSDTSVRIQENIAMAVGMVLFTLCNYAGQRYFAFKS